MQALLIVFIITMVFYLFYFWNIVKRVTSVSFPEYTKDEVFTSSRIPNVIYTYWNNPIVPPFVNKCIQSWKRHNPTYQVVILNQENLKEYIPFDMMKLTYATTQQRIADFVRSYLLKSRGGIWLDSTIYLSQSLDWVHWYQQKEQSEYVGYKINACGKSKRTSSLPIIENWFMASVPNSQFMSDWCDRFMTINEFPSIDAYVQSIKSQTNTSGIDDLLHYLTMHIAALHTQEHPTAEYKLSLLQAEKGPLLWLDHLSWSTLYSIPFILYFKGKEAPIVKYRGLERNIVQICQLYHIYE